MDRSARAREIVQRYRGLRVGQHSPLWRELERDIGRIIANGDYEQLVVLGDALERESDDPFHLAKTQALNGLALIRSPEAVDAFLRRSRRPPGSWRAPEDRYAWERAALLGHAQDLAGLDRALHDHASNVSLLEVLSSWIQECLLRGAAVSQLDDARALWQGLEERGHALSWLPLELASCERGMLRDAPRPDWIGNWFAFTRAAYPRLEGVPIRIPTPSARRTQLEEQVRKQIACFVGDEHLYPNATFEIAAFDLDTSQQPAGFGVAALPLECLASAKRVREVEVSPADAFYLLFTMATQGGAYGRGRSVAWGRLRAWQCAGALAGVPASGGFDGAVRAVERARWAFFEADSPWWFRVCIEFGLACAADRGASVRVLAATDTD
jgi:hypothetical protein